MFFFDMQILTGKAAKKFAEQLENSSKQAVSKEEYQRAEKTYKEMKKKYPGVF